MNLEAEIRKHNREIRLSESYLAGSFGDIVNPFSQFYDGLNPIFPLFPFSYDRATGFWFTDAQLRLIRLYARYLYDTNPTAHGIIRGKKNYVYGTGFTYSVQARPGQRVAKPLIEQAQAILDDFMEANQWDIREPECYIRSHRDGENIFRIFPSDDELCCADLRSVESDQIVPPDGSIEWSFGVHRELEDREKILGFGITYDGRTIDEVEPDYMGFTKINVDLVAPRGLTSLFTTQELLIGTQKLTRAMVEGESVREAIAYIISYELAPQSNVQALANLNTNFQTPTVNGKSIPTEKIVPGAVPEVNSGQKYNPPPVSDTTNATNALSSAFQQLSVFFQVPQWMVSGDTGNTNFAASLTAESPLVKDVHSEQTFFSNQNIKLFMKVLKIAEDQGRLPEGTVRKLKIFAECPSPAVRDAVKETDQNKILSDAGLLSDKTWSEREDLDYEQEQANGAKKAVDPAAPSAPSNNPAAEYQRATDPS